MMRRSLLLGPMCSVCLSCASLQTSSATADDIRAIEIRRLHSLVDFDSATAYSLHADDFQLITPDGSEFTKASYLGQLKSGQLDYCVWDPKDIRVRLYGDIAVIRYDDARFEVAVDGKLARVGLLRHIDLYEKRKGRWQVVWSQASGGQTQ